MKKCAYPQPDRARADWLNLNGTWEFSFDVPAYDTKIEVPYSWGSPLSGIDTDRNAVGYYRRTVCFRPKHERVFLHFGAVDYLAEITVNGKIAGAHKGGYTPFAFDVTDCWNADGENEIVVRAEDMGDLNTQTYGKQGYGNARGIWQTVWVESAPNAYIADFQVTTRIDGTVKYELITVGAEDGARISAEFGKYSATVEVKDNHATVELKIEDPQLWTPDTPTLYEGTLTLGRDVVSTYFGIREIGTGVFGEHARRYITLNGKPYYLNGVLDQSFNPKGYFTLPSDDDCREEIARLKRIGVNMARIHIKAEEPLKLYYADKLGLLIMEDIPCFWGEPTESTRCQYEYEMEEEIRRDRNHPALFYWVLFNETWGLFTEMTDEAGQKHREYTMETADWVVSCYHRAKQLDPNALVEDHSVCNGDHTVTDVNTWHFYSNGYERVKGVVDSFCNGAYPGSHANYRNGFLMGDIPCMNSECGNVWGIEGNAGESDISWQYKYMMSEFRLHDKLSGFVFTEFHDVINEFNGYYKIDNSDKDFGYEEYGMSLKDLHAQDFVGADCAPMTTISACEEVTVPLFISSFSDARHGHVLDVEWELTQADPYTGGSVTPVDCGEFSFLLKDYGTSPIGVIRVCMPETDGPCVLAWTVYDGETCVMRNCVYFDVEAETEGVLQLEPASFRAEGFRRSFDVQQGNKKNGLGSGAFSISVSAKDIPGFTDADNLRILFEASTREPMTHDFPDGMKENRTDSNYMLGYRCDAGANRNSYRMTDGSAYPGSVEVLIDGVSCGTFPIPDCPADSRGLLSHHYQAVDNLLDEAGSYGYLFDLRIPSAVLLKLKEKDSFILTFRTLEESGLSLYGRRSGRYGIPVVLMAE